MKKIMISILITMLLILSACSSNSNNNMQEQKNNLKVATAFYPTYFLTTRIAGNDVDVVSIVPNGVEPHDYEPTPQELIKISDADALIKIGLEFEPLENRLQETNKKMIAVDAISGMSLIEAKEHHHEGEEEEEEEEHAEETLDPHFWMSPVKMKQASENIKQGLINLDAKNTATYESNAAKLANEFDTLDTEFKNGLKNCSKKVFLTSHSAFNYLANEYGLEQVGIAGLSPETEPTPQAIVELKEEATEHNIKYIFVEELVDSRIAETLAKEVGATTLVLDPIEGIKNPDDDYFSIMRRNLANLRVALECN